MPLAAVMALEGESGQPLVTAALAEVNGRRLAGAEADAASGDSVARRHAETVMKMLDAMRADAEAFADGRLTPTEATTVDRAMSQLETAISEYRLALAGVRAGGGETIGGGK
jgi:hypothetical protein